LIVSAAEREDPRSFAAAVIVIEASPCPDAGDTVAHVESEDAVQLHSRSALTAAVMAPPLAGRVFPGALTDVAHRTAPGPVTWVTLVAPHPTIRNTTNNRHE
jgi:hypothetical protein